jgi:hypothetical protein
MAKVRQDQRLRRQITNVQALYLHTPKLQALRHRVEQGSGSGSLRWTA